MTGRPYITCRELIEFLDEYVDGSLSPERCREFERHLAVCPSCVAYLDGYRRTIELGRRALAPADKPAPADVPEGLVEAIRAARLAAR